MAHKHTLRPGMSVHEAGGRRLGTIAEVDATSFTFDGRRLPINAINRITDDAVYLTASGYDELVYDTAAPPPVRKTATNVPETPETRQQMAQPVEVGEHETADAALDTAADTAQPADTTAEMLIDTDGDDFDEVDNFDEIAAPDEATVGDVTPDVVLVADDFGATPEQTLLGSMPNVSATGEPTPQTDIALFAVFPDSPDAAIIAAALASGPAQADAPDAAVILTDPLAASVSAVELFPDAADTAFSADDADDALVAQMPETDNVPVEAEPLTLMDVPQPRIDSTQVRPGMAVIGRDGRSIGWVIDALPRQIVADLDGIGTVPLPVSAVRSVTADYIILNIPTEQIGEDGWASGELR